MVSILDRMIEDIYEKLNEMKKEDENEALGIEEKSHGQDSSRQN